MLNITILILKWSPKSPSSASWIRQTPSFSSITSYLGEWHHHPSCCASSEPRGYPDTPSPFPSSHLPLSCPFLKDSLLFPPSSVLITIIPQQDCFGGTVSGHLTFDPALPPTWSMYNGLSELLKWSSQNHLPPPHHSLAFNSFPWKQQTCIKRKLYHSVTVTRSSMTPRMLKGERQSDMEEIKHCREEKKYQKYQEPPCIFSVT